MRTVVFVFFAFLFLGSCSEAAKVDVRIEERVADVEKTVAKIGVEGMMCEIACGGKIRKELSEVNGVASADITFEEGESVNYAVVEYNPSLVTEQELMSTINQISDGKLYKVSEMTITRYAPAARISASTSDDGVSMHAPSFEVPSLVGVLYRLIGGLRN